MKKRNTLLLAFVLLLSINNAVSKNRETDSLINQLKHLPNDTNKINVLHKIVVNYYHLSEFDSAAIFANKRLELSEQLNNLKGKQLSHFQYAYIYYRKSFYETAIYHANKSLEICRERKDKRIEAECLNVLGITYKNLGEYNKSLSLFFEALQIWEGLDNKSKQLIILNNIGLSYYYMEKYEMALDYYQRSYDICQEIDCANGKSLYYNNCGLLFYKQKQYDKAHEYYKKSLQIELQQNDQYGIPICYTNIGDIYKQQGKYKKAIEYYNKGLKIRLDCANIFGIAITYLSLAELYSLEKKYSKANEYLLKCLHKSKEINALNLRKEAYQLLSENYYLQNNFLEAYKNHKLYKQACDSIFSVENNKHILELQTKYETEKKEAENRILKEQQKRNEEIIAREQAEIKAHYLIIAIAVIIFLLASALASFLYRSNKQKAKANKILRKQKEKIEVQQSQLKKTEELLKQQNIELQESNATKDKFFSIIAHDLRSPFNAMLTFSDLLLKENCGENRQEEQKELIGIINTTLKSTYKLLENLLLWSHSQKGSIEYHPEKINLYQLTSDVIKLLENNADMKSIKIDNQIPKHMVIHADANVFSIILRNLLSNSIKFTPKGGEIIIGKTSSNNNSRYTEIYVRDNGVGISDETLKDLFRLDKNTSQYGTENEKGSGLGLVLCKEMMELHNGNIKVESQLEKGSKFILSLPLNQSVI